MQNKKVIFIMGIFVLVVGAAAFVAGRMLNGQVNPLGFFGLGGKGDVMSFAVNVIPAEELPKTQPEVTGAFVERKDNTIVVASLPMKSGGGGAVKSEGGGEFVAGSRVDLDSAPKLEVVVTSETTIYRETTEFKEPSSGETQTIQQTVEESTLDDLSSQSMITVWGRKSGDRIIAEVLFYSNPIMFKRPAP